MLFRFRLLQFFLLGLQMIHDLLHQLPLEIDVKAQFAEEGEELQLFPVFGREFGGLTVTEGFLRCLKLCLHILNQAVHLGILEGKYLFVDVLQVGSAVIGRKILFVQRLQNGFDIRQ